VHYTCTFLHSSFVAYFALLKAQVNSAFYPQRTGNDHRASVADWGGSMCITTARGSDGAVLLLASSPFFANTISLTYELLHLACWTFALTCTSTTFRSFLNFKAIGQGHAYCVHDTAARPTSYHSFEQSLTILFALFFNSPMIEQRLIMSTLNRDNLTCRLILHTVIKGELIVSTAVDRDHTITTITSAYKSRSSSGVGFISLGSCLGLSVNFLS